jgi:hypothetical protein
MQLQAMNKWPCKTLQEARDECNLAREQAQQAQKEAVKRKTEMLGVERDLVVERRLNEEMHELLEELKQAHNGD